MNFALFMIVSSFFSFSADSDKQQDHNLTFSILYDNYVFAPGTQSEWGFSCLIETGRQRILFDTGTKSEILLANAKKMNVDLTNIDAIVLSHQHQDHTGGVVPILKMNPGIIVYLLPSFSSDFIQKLKEHKAEIITVPENLKIYDGIYLTGEMGETIREQSMYIETNQGIIIITGCSHQGIVNIIQEVKNSSQADIYLVFGGFHLLRHSEQQVKEIIEQFKERGVRQCGPTHCTGDMAIRLFREAYKQNFIAIGTVKIIEIK